MLEPNKAALVVLTTLYLHNFLRQSKVSRDLYTPRGTLEYEENGQLIEGSWRQEQSPSESFLPLRRVPRKSAMSAQEIRGETAAYFMNSGSVVWQNDYA